MNIREKDVVCLLVEFLVSERGFPRELLSVEKGLKRAVTSLLCQSRFDLLSFCIINGNLLPLVLFEVKKSDSMLEHGMRQVITYNKVIKAPFFAVSTYKIIVTGSLIIDLKPEFFEQYKIKWMKDIPRFEILLDIYKKLLLQKYYL